MLTAEQKDKIETLFFGKVLEQDEELEEFKANFKYLGPLGHGAFAVVVSAKWQDEDQEKQVAVKCFCKENFEWNTIEQFRKEAKMTQNIRHKHLLSNLAVCSAA